ncbi:MAG: DUF2764 family protein [Bacteroidales bacterium]
MIFKRHYYYLVAGFADLVFDSGKGYPDLAEFVEELKNNLHPSDYKIVSLLFLPYDNDNLIAFLEGKTDKWNPLGKYSASEFEEERKVLQSIVSEKDVIPPYMVAVLNQRTGEEQTIDRISTWKKLTEGYLEMALKSGSKFLRKWVSFDRDIRNIFALINAKELHLNAARYIAGKDQFAQELVAVFNSGKDFVIPQEPEYAPAIFRIATESDFLERERKIDLERWNFVDTNTFFEYFTLDLILGYLIKYMIVLRWKQLEPETGKIMLQKLIDQMEAQIMSVGFNE